MNTLVFPHRWKVFMRQQLKRERRVHADGAFSTGQKYEVIGTLNSGARWPRFGSQL